MHENEWSFLFFIQSKNIFDFFGLDHPVPEGYIYIYICGDLALQVEGELEYLHRSAASRRR
jgi:hypothetical protein